MAHNAQATDTVFGVIENLDRLVGLGLRIPKTDSGVEGSYQRKLVLASFFLWMRERKERLVRS